MQNAKIYIYVSLITMTLFLPFLGMVDLFDWDEVNFAECAREMLVRGDYSQVLMDYIPFWEKPPLFIWMQACSMKIFGVSNFAARFPNVIAAFFTFSFLIYAGSKIKERNFGLLWALVYCGSFLPNIYFHSGIIDPWFNLFIFSGIYFGYQAFTTNTILNYALSGCLIGLSILTKGPVGLLLFFAPAFLFILFNRKKFSLNIRGLFAFVFSLISAGGFWFLLLVFQGKEIVIYDFLAYQVRLFQNEDAGHGGPFYYHFVVLIIGCFPASFFALRKLSFKNKESFQFLMLLTLVFTIALFSIVQTKIIHYSSLCYFPITYLATGYLLPKIKEGEQSLKLSARILLISLGIYGLTLFCFAWTLNHPLSLLSITGVDKFTIDTIKQGLPPSLLFYLPSILVLAALTKLIYFYKKNQNRIIVIVAFLTIAISIISASFMIKRIGLYSQGGHVALCKDFKDQNVIIHPIGFKSFVPLYFGRQNTSFVKDDGTLLEEFFLANQNDLRLPVYFTSKAYKKAEILKLYPKIELIKELGGFALYKRKNNRIEALNRQDKKID